MKRVLLILSMFIGSVVFANIEVECKPVKPSLSFKYFYVHNLKNGTIVGQFFPLGWTFPAPMPRAQALEILQLNRSEYSYKALVGNAEFTFSFPYNYLALKKFSSVVYFTGSKQVEHYICDVANDLIGPR